VLADAGYGVDTAFRERLSELGLRYVVGVTGSVTVWPPRARALTAGGLRRPRACRHAPAPGWRRITATPSAIGQGTGPGARARALAHVTWREGTNAKLRSRFARVRVRAAHRDNLRE